MNCHPGTVERRLADVGSFAAIAFHAEERNHKSFRLNSERHTPGFALQLACSNPYSTIAIVP
jgi:hypothetical protein